MSNSPWHRGFHWTPQTDRRYAAWLCERISQIQGYPVENFEYMTPWYEDENVDELMNCVWWEWS